MTSAQQGSIDAFIAATIPDFHQSRLKSLGKLPLSQIIKRKNPYLFRAKNLLVASDLVRAFLDAHLSSQEEGLFGTFLEQLAIETNRIISGGRKSMAEGVDLEFERDTVLYLVSIKSGPNWGNSGQIKKLQDNFLKARRILRTNSKKRTLIAVEGCCYGQPLQKDFGERIKLCGKAFWELMSGDPDFYLRIVEPIGQDAKKHNDEFQVEYANVLNRFVLEFSKDFCELSGQIDWEKLIRFNSGV